MNFVADESLDQQIVTRLREDGHNIWYVLEMESGIDDETVLRIANEQNSPLLTADKDFGELVFRLRRVNAGVVLVRLFGLSPTSKSEVVSQGINEHLDELWGAFTVITATTIRIRKLKS